MDRDLIDRRRRRDRDGQQWQGRCEGWTEVVVCERSDEPDPGSPLLSDHQRSLELIESEVGRYRETAERAAREAARSRSRRHGFQPNAERNIRAYLLRALLDCTDGELAEMLAYPSRQSARSGRLCGARLVASRR